MTKIQRVEIQQDYATPIHCCFCGQRVLALGNEQDPPLIAPCDHTLFVAHDEGFEFLSGRAASNLGAKGYTFHRHDSGMFDIANVDPQATVMLDGITDAIDIPDSVKIASYMPAPSFMGAYVGFAPDHD
jgi:hypothetical protein